METISNCYKKTKLAITSVIECRTPATAPYFLLINTAFWLSVFRLEQEKQMHLLISLSAGIFGWDVLLSPSYDRSILLHVLLWPVRNLLRTTSVVSLLYSAHSLHLSNLETACWTAYAAVVLILLDPVWRAHQMPQKISKSFTVAYCVAKPYTISPICKLFQIIQYILLFKWVYALRTIVVHACANLAHVARCAKNSVIGAIACIVGGVRRRILSFFSSLMRLMFQLRRTTCGIIIACINSIINFFLAIQLAIVNFFNKLKNVIKSFVVGVYRRIVGIVVRARNCLVHFFAAVIGGSLRVLQIFVVSMKSFLYNTNTYVRNALQRTISALRDWIDRRIVQPICNAYNAVKRFLRYWLLAHWWPDLKLWLHLKVARRAQRMFNYFCFALVYVVCCYWFDPFSKFVGRWVKIFYVYLRRTVLIPLKIWAKRKMEESLRLFTELLHYLAIAIRDSVMWPIGVLFVALLKKLYTHFHRIFIQPIIDALYRKYKVGEDYILIHFLAPFCIFLLNHIPERSPLCDDTDTELAELLPPGFEDEVFERKTLKSSQKTFEETPMKNADDEHHFVRGLRFPSVDASESSDDEFTLRPRFKPRSQKRSASRRQQAASEAKVPKDPSPLKTDQRKNNGDERSSNSPASETESNASYTPLIPDSTQALDFSNSD